jgi:hypothetical protein
MRIEIRAATARVEAVTGALNDMVTLSLVAPRHIVSEFGITLNLMREQREGAAFDPSALSRMMRDELQGKPDPD